MQRKYVYIIAVLLLAIGLGACKRNPGIIKYPSPMSNLKNAPHDTTKEDKQAAAQTHTQLAVAYMNQDHLKEADAALHKALTFDNNYVPAHTVLAILDWKINRFDDADKEFRAAIAINPKDGDTNNNYGKFLCARHREKEAMEHFRIALADPFYKTPTVANANAGECLVKSGDYAGAEPYLRKALELDPNYGPALLAMAQLDLDQNQAFQARGYMQRFEAAGQATAESLLLGYQIAHRLGDNSTATSYYNRLQTQFPNSAQAQSFTGPTHD